MTVNEYNNQFENVVEGLLEYYPELKSLAPALKNKLRDGYISSGNDQLDYESLRDKVENQLNKMIVDEEQI